MEHSCVAIIPARGGSKRIPRKNIRAFLSKPIIEYSILAAVRSNCFDEIMVSTDDREIAQVARACGASVPFYRSERTSDDFAGVADVIDEVLNEFAGRGSTFRYCCCILPTAPFITPEMIQKGYNILLNSDDADSVIPVTRYPYPIQRSFVIRDGYLRMFWPENYSKLSQDLEPVYHDSGQFYWLRIDSFIKSKMLFMDNAIAIELPEMMVQDIDTEEDWRIAELKYRTLFASDGRHE